jgi:fumarylacetoacetase
MAERRPDDTHDVSLRSWLECANNPGTDFPIQNLPFGVFRSGGPTPSIGVAIGEFILDLRAAAAHGFLDGLDLSLRSACSEPSLNLLMAQPPEAWTALRRRVSQVLRTDASPRPDQGLLPMAKAEMLVPAVIGDYTDFYASIDHATNVGRLFRPDNPLLPNYSYVPVAYHGRASSVVIDGTPVRRPRGQIKRADTTPVYVPTEMLDYEVEVGMWIGAGNDLGEPVAIEQAEEHLFGFCLLNDWSARDIQSWEYQPLGPFLAKNFATTISPWIVTVDALVPFRAPVRRPADTPASLPHLRSEENERSGAFAITVEASLRTGNLAEVHVLSRASFKRMYWTPAQMIAHHTSNGCNLRPGDLFGSGTVSGPSEHERGCLLELTSRGAHPLLLPDGERRTFLEDGDEVTLHAFCERDGFRRIGFGTCTGRIVPA